MRRIRQHNAADRDMRPTRIHSLLAASILAAFGFAAPAANISLAVPVTPQAAAMADNALPLVHGLDALSENPAALAWPQKNSWELQMFSVATAIGSNAFGFGDYLAYNGAVLSDADKAKILAKVPVGGWRLGAHAEASAAALRIGTAGARLSAYGAARGNFDRGILEILFYGNERDRVYVSNLNSGEAFAAAELALSYAGKLRQRNESTLYGGVTLRLIRGLYYAELEQAQGDLVAAMTGMTGSGHATATIAEGGNGIALNWGAMMALPPRYTLALVVENAPGIIRWSTAAQEKQYRITFEGITADNFEDSLWVNEETAVSLPSFTRSLPPRVRVGVGRNGENLQLAATASIGFADRLAVSTTPEFGVGAEYTRVSFLPLRAGVSVGGLDGFTTGLGAGIVLNWFHLEVGLRTAGGVWPTHGRGAALAIAGGLRF